MHFNRNNSQRPKVSYRDISASDSGFKKLPPEKSVFHRIGKGNENNEKWVNDKGEEYVFNPSTYPPRFVTDAVNMGTYNYLPASDLTGHYLLDVLPYILWGNSESDETTFSQRARLFDKEFGRGAQKEILRRLQDGIPQGIQDKFSEFTRNAKKRIAELARNTKYQYQLLWDENDLLLEELDAKVSQDYDQLRAELEAGLLRYGGTVWKFFRWGSRWGYGSRHRYGGRRQSDSDRILAAWHHWKWQYYHKYYQFISPESGYVGSRRMERWGRRREDSGRESGRLRRA